MRANPELISILIADDDADDRMMAKEALEECRLANPVDFVEDGVELLAYLRGQGPLQPARSDGGRASSFSTSTCPRWTAARRFERSRPTRCCGESRSW